MPTPRHDNPQTVVLTLLKELRARAGLTQRELAEILDWPENVVCTVESGRRRLDFLELREVCVACGTSLSSFVAELEQRQRGIDG